MVAWCMSSAWLGHSPGLGWACAVLHPLVLGLRPGDGLGWGFCRARVGLGGVVWWSVVGWGVPGLSTSFLAYPLSYPWPILTMVPVLSLAYP